MRFGQVTGGITSPYYVPVERHVIEFSLAGITMKGDVGWLRKSLASALGWDEQLTEGVAEAIAAAQSRTEVEELAQVFYRQSQLP